MDIDTEKPQNKKISRKQNLRCLVVEDNKVNQLVICGLLKVLGLDTDMATNGVEGLNLWLENNYDIILTDCQMPEMNGYEMATAIRNEEEKILRKRTPIIAITANALQGDIGERITAEYTVPACTAPEYIAAGIDDCLSKPVDINKLRELLTRSGFLL